MKVAGLDKNNDWRFGRGKASYLTGSNAIAQKVVTRLRCFKRDWFLDITEGIDWFSLLTSRNSEEKILREVERVIVSTTGVLRLISLEIDVKRSDRSAVIRASYEDVFYNLNDVTEVLNP